MSDILQRIVAKKREEVGALQRAQPLECLMDRVQGLPPALDFTEAMRGARPRGTGRLGGRVNIIAEIKLRSPSKGAFRWHGDAVRQAHDYEAGLAAATSVVTDGPFFGGSTELLRKVKSATELPVLQKEFLLEPWQVYYARALGADACLLIAAILPGEALAHMLETARQAGIHTLVEVVDAEEHRRATEAGAVVIGVNNRDLKTFTVDPRRTEALVPLYRDDQVCVAESGIRTAADVAHLLQAGVDGFLIGESLMTAPNPVAHLRALRGVPAREAAS
jgi:indole-3-glycerol phosphate synthase